MPTSLAAVEELRVPRTMTVLAAVELNEVGVGVLDLADEDGDAQDRVGRVEHRLGAARALARRG